MFGRRERTRHPANSPPSSGLRLEAGGTTVEMALTITIFMMIVMTIVDLGLFVHQYTSMSHMARVGARYAAAERGQAKTEAQIITVVRDSGPNFNGMTVAVTPANAAARSNGALVTVSVTADFVPVTPFLPLVSGLTSEAEVTTEP
ncbi:MAG TPA: TadE/TadG family type IV pilus assembly protein [Chloroflexota bacterium]|nr:TadE/TadG family type IV pilus assembly protein [Chloroflexota bacterium]